MKSETKRPLDVLLRAVANPIIALILAFLLSGLVVLISGDDPMEAYAAILQGAFGSKSNLINTVRYMLPILMLALSFTLCDSCGYFNIGQEGQMYSAVVTMAWIQGLLHILPVPPQSPGRNRGIRCRHTFFPALLRYPRCSPARSSPPASYRCCRRS